MQNEVRLPEACTPKSSHTGKPHQYQYHSNTLNSQPLRTVKKILIKKCKWVYTCTHCAPPWAHPAGCIARQEGCTVRPRGKVPTALSTAPLTLLGHGHPTACMLRSTAAHSQNQQGRGSSMHFVGTLIFHGLSGFGAPTIFYCTDELPSDTHNLE